MTARQANNVPHSQSPFFCLWEHSTTDGTAGTEIFRRVRNFRFRAASCSNLGTPSSHNPYNYGHGYAQRHAYDRPADDAHHDLGLINNQITLRSSASNSIDISNSSVF